MRKGWRLWSWFGTGCLGWSRRTFSHDSTIFLFFLCRIVVSPSSSIQHHSWFYQRGAYLPIVRVCCARPGDDRPSSPSHSSSYHSLGYLAARSQFWCFGGDLGLLNIYLIPKSCCSGCQVVADRSWLSWDAWNVLDWINICDILHFRGRSRRRTCRHSWCLFFVLDSWGAST